MYHVTYFLYEIVNKISDHNIFTIKPLQLLNELFSNSMYQSMDKLHISKGDYDRDFSNHSVLDSNVQMSQYYLCHILALDCMNLKEKKKIN